MRVFLLVCLMGLVGTSVNAKTDTCDAKEFQKAKVLLEKGKANVQRYEARRNEKRRDLIAALVEIVQQDADLLYQKLQSVESEYDQALKMWEINQSKENEIVFKKLELERDKTAEELDLRLPHYASLRKEVFAQVTALSTTGGQLHNAIISNREAARKAFLLEYKKCHGAK